MNLYFGDSQYIGLYIVNRKSIYRPIYCESCDYKVCGILQVTEVITGIGVLIFGVNRSRIGVGVSKRDCGHLCPGFPF